MICSRFDVVVVPFPFLERPVHKLRPALVLSTRQFNADNAHTIMAMITTGAGSRWPTDHAIGDLDHAGLKHASIVRWKLFTLPNDLLQSAIGSFSAADRNAVTAAGAAILLA